MWEYEGWEIHRPISSAVHFHNPAQCRVHASDIFNKLEVVSAFQSTSAMQTKELMEQIRSFKRISFIKYSGSVNLARSLIRSGKGQPVKE